MQDPKESHSGEHAFAFDRVFWPEASQEELFENVAVASIDHCFDGYNSCCFAYGQTGSGKTFTMFGEAGDQRGIIPRSGDAAVTAGMAVIAIDNMLACAWAVFDSIE